MSRHSVSRSSASKTHNRHSTTKVPSPPRQTHVSSSGSAWAAVDAAYA